MRLMRPTTDHDLAILESDTITKLDITEFYFFEAWTFASVFKEKSERI